VEIINGLRRPTAASSGIRGVEVTGDSPRTIRKRKLAHIPQDRMKDGRGRAGIGQREPDRRPAIFRREFSSVLGRLRKKHIDEHSSDSRTRLRHKTPDTRTGALAVRGNIQKVVVVASFRAPEIVVASHPTRALTSAPRR